MDWHNLMSTLATQASDLELLQLQTAVEPPYVRLVVAALF